MTITEKNVVVKKPRPSLPPWFMIGIVILTICMGFRKFTDAFFQKDGKWTMKKSYKEKVINSKDNFEDCEVYYLVALDNGFYSCKLCKRQSFYLRQGEIWKIGKTCQGRKRYGSEFYRNMRLEYIPVSNGNLHEVTRQEVIELGNYSSRHQNMSRPDPSPQSQKKGRYKLLYPPGNTGLY